MEELIVKLWKFVPPVGRVTRPGLAAVIGFAFGGIGLAIYFRTLVDVLVPIALTVGCVLVFDQAAGFGWFFGALVSATYGYFRSGESNQRLGAAADRPAVGAR
ncbi:hypothetical protein [uncultured Friedmanniella sp.]|uniref:hypothetical protein n=1 Tax=uncultured Friedmanniella sp. TaxID=335381 RepID=UPI0035CB4819